MKKVLLLGVSVGVFFCSTEARVVLKNRTLHYTEELIDGRTFGHRQEFLEGGIKNTWKVDGEPVEREVYDELILDAERGERQKERKQAYDERVADYLFRHESQQALLKKLIKAEVDIIKHELNQLKKYNLEGYLAFSQSGIANEQEYFALLQNLLPQATELLCSLTGDVGEYQALMAMHERLEPYADKVKAFVRATVASAIERCDDTKFLKELLALVS